MVSNVNFQSCFLRSTLVRKYLRRVERNVHVGVGCCCELGKRWGADDDVPTMRELRVRFMKMRGVEPGYTLHPPDRSYLLKYLPKSQDELPPRRVKDTIRRAVIPLGSRPKLEEKYVAHDGSLRFGRLMEDLDMFSDWVSMNYIRNPLQPEGEIASYAMVTVRVDHITFSGYNPRSGPGMDVRITGHVSGVGKTTVETTVWMEQSVDGVYQLIMKAIFLMAARNPLLTGGVFVNPLVAEDEDEKRILAEGKQRMRDRLARTKQPYLSQVPSPEEQQIIHRLFMDSIDNTVSRRVLPPGNAWMSDSLRTNNIISFTEDRNFVNTVFGGFLMRHALETAWFTGYFYSKHRVRLRCISDILFRKPVPVGSIVAFHGRVVYTEGRLMEIFVHGDINKPSEADIVTSIMFYFTYESPEPVPSVRPNSYYEAMMFLDGRRHFLEVMNRTEGSA